MLTLAQLYSAAGGTTAVTVGLVWLEKKFGWIKPVVQDVEDFAANHKSLVADAGTAASTLLGDVLHSPHVAELEAKAKHVEDELAKTQLVKLAGDVLRSAGKRLDSLTSNQKTGYALVISTEAKKLGLNVTQSRIESAMTAADKAIDTIAALPLFQSTQTIDAPEPSAVTSGTTPSTSSATATTDAPAPATEAPTTTAS